jgi:hypothetical protein
VIEAIEELDLEPFYASYRADGHGRAAHDPKMMVTLFTYAFRVICANQAPDPTIARGPMPSASAHHGESSAAAERTWGSAARPE